ncbi:MFS transporter [Streptomyces sp. NPDC096311]|uniref:MFS transporter n=1 Tax=Streptomyces sp. NPDC096311 TaxID=3366083 RepID=UPI00381D6EA2
MDQRPERGLGYYILIIFLVELVVETATLSVSMVYPALPLMAGALHTTDIAWIITIVLLVSGALFPLGGKLADRFGERRMLTVLVGGFAAGSLICALSDSFTLTLVGRALQAGAILLSPIAWALFRSILPSRLVPIAVSVVATGFGVGIVAGPLLSGALTDHFGYHSLFWFMFGYAILAAAVSIPLLPATPPRFGGSLDLAGAALLVVAIGAALLALSEGGIWGWTSARTVGSAACFVVATAAFIAVELRSREPLMDLGLLRGRAFSITMLVVIVGGFPNAVFPFLVPQMLESPHAPGATYAFGLSLVQVGLVTMPNGLAAMAAGPLGGWLSRRNSPRLVMLLGLLFTALSMLLLALFHTHLYEYALASGVLGVGFGFFFAATSNLVMAATPRSSVGVASGMAFTAQGVTNAVSTTVAATVLSHHVLSVSAGGVMFTERGYELGFWIAGACSLAAAVVAFAMRHGRRPVGQDTAVEVGPTPAEQPA